MGVAIAVSFVWLGMVLGISFIEAPVKFRATGVTTQIGLGIGRLVFRVMNAAEAILAVVLLVTVIAGAPGPAALASAIVAVAALALQVFAVRPVLNRRTAAVLAGAPHTASHAHQAYIALEVVKVAALVVGGVLLLGGA
jgi:hypothetical protein